MRNWSCLQALSVPAAGKLTARFLFLAVSWSVSLHAQDRWTLQFFYDKQDSSLDIRDIQCPSAQRCIAAGAINENGREKGAVISTSDGGQHWSVTEEKEAPVSLYFLNDSVGWMVTERGIWRSDNGGTTWMKQEALRNVVRIHFIDPSHGYAVGSPAAVYQTSDGGKKWAKLAAASVPPADPKRTVYDCIAFQGQHGIITGWTVLEQPDLLLGPAAPLRNAVSSTVVALDTVDGGGHWTSRALTSVVAVLRARFAKDGPPLFLVQFPARSGVPTGLIRGPIGVDGQQALFAEKNRVVIDFALLPNAGGVLAAIEPPGNSNQLPIPGKLKMFESSDLVAWHEADVDYRAVARRAVLAVGDSTHQWVVTDTGMILGRHRTESAGSRQNNSIAGVLSTSSPQSLGPKPLNTQMIKP